MHLHPSDRTGVQLKDKWRNLVKFKHVSRVEADVAASKSATINTRCAGLKSLSTILFVTNWDNRDLVHAALRP